MHCLRAGGSFKVMGVFKSISGSGNVECLNLTYSTHSVRERLVLSLQPNQEINPETVGAAQSDASTAVSKGCVWLTFDLD